MGRMGRIGGTRMNTTGAPAATLRRGHATPRRSVSASAKKTGRMSRTAPRQFINALMVLALAAPLGTAAIAHLVAQPSRVDPALYAGLRWRSIGPFRAGRVNSVSGVPGQPGVFYAGSVGGGVWKTTNAGRTWLPIFDSQPIASIGAVAVAPSNPDVVYVGTGEADMRSQISFGNGMYKSTDAGKTWTR